MADDLAPPANNPDATKSLPLDKDVSTPATQVTRSSDAPVRDATAPRSTVFSTRGKAAGRHLVAEESKPKVVVKGDPLVIKAAKKAIDPSKGV